MSSILTISLYITYGKDLISEHGFKLLWAFYSAYVILITARIVSNPNKHAIDRGWEFHKRSTESTEEDVKKNHVLTSLKPRVQSIVLSLSFIVSIFVLIKILIAVVTSEPSLAVLFVEIKSNDLASIVLMLLGAVPAVFISEVLLKIFPPLVKE